MSGLETNGGSNGPKTILLRNKINQASVPKPNLKIFKRLYTYLAL